jgi:hypothetical protein
MADEFKKIPDNEWTHVQAAGFRHACCDCGLVHVMDFRVSGEGRLQVKWRRSPQATARRRKGNNGGKG